MPIEAGPYCQYCVDAKGKLQPFDERFERMVQWQAKREPTASRADLEKKTLERMASMPAWQDHPRVRRAAAT
jgi:hypothetical protein